MDFLKEHIITRIISSFPALEGSLDITVFERPKNPEHGDCALPCFRFSKTVRKSPADLSCEIKKIFENDQYFYSVDTAGPYLNFKFERTGVVRKLFSSFKKNTFFDDLRTLGNNKTVVIDYSHPNVAKNMGIHNLRSTIIGQSLYNIYSFLGYKTVGVNHLGDWGTQFGKLMYGLETWSSKDELKEKGILHLNDIYVKFHSEAEKDPSLEPEARKWFVRLENNDPEAVSWWKLFIDVSLVAYNGIYRRLNVKFDHITGESFYIQFLEHTLKELDEHNLTEISEGALVVKFDDDEMPPCLLKKTDGATLYGTRDIAAAMYRVREFSPHRIIYVTDIAQELHFRQVFKVMELYRPELRDIFFHVKFGRLSFPDMEMSTRKGNIVPLEDVLDKAKEKVQDIMKERDFSKDQIDITADRIGTGAVIFNDLSVSRIKNSVFDWQKTLSFEGETGPHVQYSYVRMINILEKVEIDINDDSIPEDLSSVSDDHSFELIKNIYLFDETVKRAHDEFEPSVIAGYTVELSKSFNRFYQNNRVIGESSEVIKARSILLKILMEVYGACMDMLNLPKITKM